MGEDKKKKVEVLLYGLGAIGSFYAFILSRSPRIRLSVIARSNYTAITTYGVHMKSENHGEHIFRPDVVLKRPSEAGHAFDYIVCANKATDLAASAQDLECVVEEGRTRIVIMQNGVGNEDAFHGMFPRCVILSGVVWIGAVQDEPGVVRQHVSESTTIGIFENGGISTKEQKDALREFTSFFEEGKHPFVVEENIQTARWKKCIWNAAWNSLNTLTGVDTHAWLKSSDYAMETTRRLMGEAVEVAKAVGVPGIEKNLVDELIETMVGFKQTVWTSMYWDSKAGRAMEVEVILGNIVRKGRERGVPVPTLEACYAMVLAVDQRLGREWDGRS